MILGLGGTFKERFPDRPGSRSRTWDRLMFGVDDPNISLL